MKRELRVTNINGKVYLFPVPVVKERKYLILCPSEEVALKIAVAVQAGSISHPDLVTEDFLYLTLHNDRRTKIFTLNPIIKMY
jgi:hypothetical protein